MCKIFAITEMAKVEVTPKLLEVIKNHVARHDNHGFGYAIVGNNGEIGGERSIRVPSFRPMALDTSSVSRSETCPIVQRTTNDFGDLMEALKSPKSLIAHGRISTNKIGLAETHPFYNGDTALIHNGVVSDATGSVSHLLETENDTEILFRYWEENGMKAIEENVAGYYAVALLETDGRLHLARDNKASLHLTWVRTINSYMIATTPEIIKGVCKSMRWKHDSIAPVLDNCYAIFDGNTIVEHRNISPRAAAYTREMQEKTKLAFGSPAMSEAAWSNTVDDAPRYHSRRDYNSVAEYYRELEKLEEMEDLKELEN